MNELTQSGQPLTPEEQLSFQIWMWRLLAHQTALYTMGDSTSVPQKTAEELLESLLYTLGAQESAPDRIRELMSTDPNAAYTRGVRALEKKTVVGKALWEQVCLNLPDLENQSMQETLRSLEGLWKRYDLRYFAHQIPADIDYQLSCPVPDTLQGVDYVNEYLRRLLAENRFLCRFAPERAARVLRSSCPDYRGLLINLFEPVAVNAVGLVLVGRDPLALEITDADREIIRMRLGSRPGPALTAGAHRLCGLLEIWDPEERRCLIRLATSLLPRIQAARELGDLSGIFLSLTDH